jgi:hypothetical protein
MYTLAAGEKTTLVMVYTETMLVRGEVVTTENIRVNTWLRTAGVPEFMHILKAQVLLFGSGGVKTLAYTEIFLPVNKIIAFHPVLPADNILDYAEDEKNRVMVPMTAVAGTFLFKGKLRISSLSGLGTSIEMAHSAWTSLYEVEITNPYLAQMPPLHVPMLLAGSKYVTLALEGD